MSESNPLPASQSLLRRRMLFVGIEASGPGADPFPIEIGWCNAQGHGASHLIRPAPHWKMGKYAPQAAHRITREELEERGKPASEVARRVARVFEPDRALVLSDFPQVSQVWLDSLFAVGGVATRVRLEPLLPHLVGAGAERLLGAGVPSCVWHSTLRAIAKAVEQAVAARATHRARAYAQRNAAIWRDAMRRIDAVATANVMHGGDGSEWSGW